MTHYTVTPGVAETLPHRIAVAYAAAGLTPPSRTDALRLLLDQEPAPDALAAQLAAESLTVADLDAWTVDALAQIHRAQSVDMLRKALAQHRGAAIRANGPTLIREAVSGLSKPFTKAAAILTKAAGNLPEQPFDLDAVMATDATAAHRDALAALTLLGTLASVHTIRATDLPPGARDALLVVDVPTVSRAHLNRLTRTVTNPDPLRDQVRAFITDAGSDVDRALVNVVRGHYGETVTLSLAADTVDARARWTRAEVAAGATVVDTKPPVTPGRPVVVLSY